MTMIVIGALVIGLTLGMLGSGGSAITVPILIYMVGHGAKESIAESMAIVGLISIVAAIPYAKSKQIDWRSVWYFGIPGMLGTFVGAWLGGIASEELQLLVFGGVLLAAAYSMLRKPSDSAKQNASDPDALHRSPVLKIATEGTVVGIVTGFVGVGGGFLIVPALVVLARLPMRLAIGTSLVIIAMKAGIGFAKYEHYLLSHEMSVNWETISAFTMIGVMGSFAGGLLNARLNQQVLKQVFAGFLILLGGFVIVHEGSKLLQSSPSAANATIESGKVLTSKARQVVSRHN
jgi:uncharacterized membrane protein YfcA